MKLSHALRTAPRVLFTALLLLDARATLMAEDLEGSADHSLISRFQGSEIIGYRFSEFDQYRLANASANGFRGGNRSVPVEQTFDDQNSMGVEGRVTMITYRAPTASSTLQILRSYERALSEAGFETVFACTNQECSGERPTGCSTCGSWERRFADAVMQRANLRLSGSVHEDQRFLASRLRRPEGDVFVSLLVLGLENPLTQLDVVEVEELAGGLVSVDAATMAREIRSKGSVALYAIYFDTDSAVVKPESAPALQQIARLMQDVPEQSLLVVGHTDNAGTFERNMALSLERAKAVVDALVAELAVNRNRLAAYGVGPLSPVASNVDEDGRALNRRVTLVGR
jgi:OmpA-OmpF porin, OOP family